VIAVDTSAVVAILWDEADAPRLRTSLEVHWNSGSLISTANLLELQLVLAGSRSRTGWPLAEALLSKYRVRAHSFDERQLHIAREAAVRYGKGRHKAGLNFGDCFAYALAKTEDLPLLCTGHDFAATDIAMA
jgi:ribonuclease VapC